MGRQNCGGWRRGKRQRGGWAVLERVEMREKVAEWPAMGRQPAARNVMEGQRVTAGRKGRQRRGEGGGCCERRRGRGGGRRLAVHWGERRRRSGRTELGWTEAREEAAGQVGGDLAGGDEEEGGGTTGNGACYFDLC